MSGAALLNREHAEEFARDILHLTGSTRNIDASNLLWGLFIATGMALHNAMKAFPDAEPERLPPSLTALQAALKSCLQDLYQVAYDQDPVAYERCERQIDQSWAPRIDPGTEEA